MPCDRKTISFRIPARSDQVSSGGSRYAWPRLFCWLMAFLCCGCASYNRNAEGLRYFNQARYDQAVVAFQAALNADPENPDIYYNIASTYHQSAKISMQTGQVAAAVQQYDEADKYYRLCLARDANHTATYRGLAALNMERQQPNVAFDLLIGWTQTNPLSPDPKIELARLYQEFSQICLVLGRTEDAKSYMDATLRQLESVLVTDPENFRALRAMGYIREQSGDLVNAISDYRRSLLSNPNQKDLEARITALQQGAGYTAPVSGITTPAATYPSSSTVPGASVYGASSQPTVSSTLGRLPF